MILRPTRTPPPRDDTRCSSPPTPATRGWASPRATASGTAPLPGPWKRSTSGTCPPPCADGSPGIVYDSPEDLGAAYRRGRDPDPGRDGPGLVHSGGRRGGHLGHLRPRARGQPQGGAACLPGAAAAWGSAHCWSPTATTGWPRPPSMAATGWEPPNGPTSRPPSTTRCPGGQGSPALWLVHGRGHRAAGRRQVPARAQDRRPGA